MFGSISETPVLAELGSSDTFSPLRNRRMSGFLAGGSLEESHVEKEIIKTVVLSCVYLEVSQIVMSVLPLCQVIKRKVEKLNSLWSDKSDQLFGISSGKARKKLFGISYLKRQYRNQCYKVCGDFRKRVISASNHLQICLKYLDQCKKNGIKVKNPITYMVMGNAVSRGFAIQYMNNKVTMKLIEGAFDNPEFFKLLFRQAWAIFSFPEYNLFTKFSSKREIIEKIIDDDERYLTEILFFHYDELSHLAFYKNLYKTYLKRILDRIDDSILFLKFFPDMFSVLSCLEHFPEYSEDLFRLAGKKDVLKKILTNSSQLTHASLKKYPKFQAKILVHLLSRNGYVLFRKIFDLSVANAFGKYKKDFLEIIINDTLLSQKFFQSLTNIIKFEETFCECLVKNRRKEYTNVVISNMKIRMRINKSNIKFLRLSDDVMKFLDVFKNDKKILKEFFVLFNRVNNLGDIVSRVFSNSVLKLAILHNKIQSQNERKGFRNLIFLNKKVVVKICTFEGLIALSKIDQTKNSKVFLKELNKVLIADPEMMKSIAGTKEKQELLCKQYPKLKSVLFSQNK